MTPDSLFSSLSSIFLPVLHFKQFLCFQLTDDFFKFIQLLIPINIFLFWYHIFISTSIFKISQYFPFLSLLYLCYYLASKYMAHIYGVGQKAHLGFSVTSFETFGQPNIIYLMALSEPSISVIPRSVSVWFFFFSSESQLYFPSSVPDWLNSRNCIGAGFHSIPLNGVGFVLGNS